MNKQPAFCREAEKRIFERRWSSFSSVHLRNISSQRRGLGRRSLKNTIGSPITTSMGKQTALENSTYYSMAGTQRLYSSNYMYWLVGKLMAFQYDTICHLSQQPVAFTQLGEFLVPLWHWLSNKHPCAEQAYRDMPINSSTHKSCIFFLSFLFAKMAECCLEWIEGGWVIWPYIWCNDRNVSSGKDLAISFLTQELFPRDLVILAWSRESSRTS